MRFSLLDRKYLFRRAHISQAMNMAKIRLKFALHTLILKNRDIFKMSKDLFDEEEMKKSINHKVYVRITLEYNKKTDKNA